MAAPVLAVGDGALGFWSAVREVFPEAREQRCWWHKIGNVLNALPKSTQPGAKKVIAKIWNAEDKDHAFLSIFRQRKPVTGKSLPHCSGKSASHHFHRREGVSTAGFDELTFATC